MEFSDYSVGRLRLVHPLSPLLMYSVFIDLAGEIPWYNSAALRGKLSEEKDIVQCLFIRRSLMTLNAFEDRRVTSHVEFILSLFMGLSHPLREW